jgi:hypothetical protein
MTPAESWTLIFGVAIAAFLYAGLCYAACVLLEERR